MSDDIVAALKSKAVPWQRDHRYKDLQRRPNLHASLGPHADSN